VHVGVLVVVDVVLGDGRAQVRNREVARGLLAERVAADTDVGDGERTSRHNKRSMAVAVPYCARAARPGQQEPAMDETLDPATALPRLEARWMQAWLDRDRATCEAILGDDFQLTSARGVLIDKPAWLDAAMGPIRGTSFTWDDVRVRPFGDVAIVHARTRQQASVGDQDWSGVFLVTDVWVLRDGRWQVVSRHGTGPLPA